MASKRCDECDANPWEHHDPGCPKLTGVKIARFEAEDFHDTVTRFADRLAGSLVQEEAARRKATPLATGCLDYFPDALAAVAQVSRIGNDQHNPGEPLHWDRSKSNDEADALLRHFVDRGEIDTDGVRHSAKVAWRALALLQKEIEAAQA